MPTLLIPRPAASFAHHDGDSVLHRPGGKQCHVPALLVVLDIGQFSLSHVTVLHNMLINRSMRWYKMFNLKPLLHVKNMMFTTRRVSSLVGDHHADLFGFSSG